jgi:hypothetical protein
MARIRRADWGPRFIDSYRASGNVRLSATSAGIDRDTVYKRRKRDERFAADWAAAQEDAIDVLEAEARRRALSASDQLLMFLLKAHRPGTYRDNARLELTGPAGGPIVTQQVLSGLDDHARFVVEGQTILDFHADRGQIAWADKPPSVMSVSTEAFGQVSLRRVPKPRARL